MPSTRAPASPIATVLLVEPNVELRYSIAGFLTRNKYRVWAAFDATDALKVAKAPRGSADLSALLRQERPHTPVLNISGSQLVEPAQLQALLVRIRELLA